MKPLFCDPEYPETKERAKAVIDLLKPMELTISEVRDILLYIDHTIEKNVVLR